MPRVLGSRLVVYGDIRKVINPGEDWDIIDGFFIIASTKPIIRSKKHAPKPARQFPVFDPVIYPSVRLKFKYPRVRLKLKPYRPPPASPPKETYIIHRPEEKNKHAFLNPLSIGEIDLICWERLSPERTDTSPVTAQQRRTSNSQQHPT
tara:strand:+ start:17493 stop:17939 length:447 start_codon:yes stop_codon:yes gene_type:complete